MFIGSPQCKSWGVFIIFVSRYTNGYGGLFLLASLFLPLCYNISQVITLQ